MATEFDLGGNSPALTRRGQDPRVAGETGIRFRPRRPAPADTLHPEARDATKGLYWHPALKWLPHMQRQSRQLRSCFVGTFDQLVDKLDANSGLKGLQFERIAKWFLINDPTYKSLLRRVWLWKEWRDRWSDLEAGIDIVAEDFDGKLWAVQYKAYRADRTITKVDIDKFLSESNRPVFAERLLIATTDNIHHVARNTMSAQEKSVSVVGLEALRLTDSYLDWPDSPDDLRPPKPTKRARPHDYQLEAIKDVVKGFKTADRGKLIMACGTGKTLTALFIRDKLAAERTLVLVPSLSLLKQTMRVWQTSMGGEPPFKSKPVCSDATVSRAEQDAPVAHTSDLGVPVTTDPAEIAAFLRKRGPRVVFATYQSSPQIAKAFELERVPAFDLVVADEAHRCAGPVSSSRWVTLGGGSNPGAALGIPYASSEVWRWPRTSAAIASSA